MTQVKADLMQLDSSFADSSGANDKSCELINEDRYNPYTKTKLVEYL